MLSGSLAVTLMDAGWTPCGCRAMTEVYKKKRERAGGVVAVVVASLSLCFLLCPLHRIHLVNAATAP